jgi:hypothetical protein
MFCVPQLDKVIGRLADIVPVEDRATEGTDGVKALAHAHIQTGVPRRHILVTHSNWQGVDRLLARLNETLGPDTARDPKEATNGHQIRVCTLNAATGLESPIVFLVGLKSLYEQEQSVRISDDERIELIRDNTRKIYMAITRAGQRIVITYCGELPDWLRARS